MNQTLAQLRAAAKETAERSTFFHVCKALAVGHGRPDAALDFARENGAPLAAQAILKNVVAGGSTANLPELAGTSTIIASYMDTLAGSSIFARAIADGALHRAPFHTRIIAAANPLQANEIAEGKPVRVRGLDLVAKSFGPRMAAAITVASDELWRSTDPRGVVFVERLLREAVASAVDAAVLATLDDANDFTAVIDDLQSFKNAFRNALSAIHKTPGHRIMVACSTQAANDLTGLDDAGRIDPLGGSIFGLPTVVTTGVTEGLVLVDWASVIGEVSRIEVVASNGGSLQLDDAPTNASDTPTATNLVSMFQTNTTAVKAGVWFACEQNRDDVAATITLEAS